jgi:hypothetical protein
MKKGLITIVCLVTLSLAAIPVGAQTRSRSASNSRYGSRYNQRSGIYSNQVYRDSRYREQVYGDSRYRNDDYYGRDRSVWDRSRDKITTAAGAGGGAVLGAMIGGKKGAIIGAIAGGGAAALYTYKIRNKGYRRY